MPGSSNPSGSGAAPTRRSVLAAAATVAGTGLAGCSGGGGNGGGDGGGNSEECATDVNVESYGNQVAPNTLIDFEYAPANDRLHIQHEGGERVTLENTCELRVVVDGTVARTIELPFEVGETVTVEGVDPGQEVQVVWMAVASPSGREHTSPLAETTVAENEASERISEKLGFEQEGVL